MGRPRARDIGPGGGREDRVALRLGPLEKQAFVEAAELAGISLSAWIRERLRWAATKELEAAMRPIPFLEPLTMGDSGA